MYISFVEFLNYFVNASSAGNNILLLLYNKSTKNNTTKSNILQQSLKWILKTSNCISLCIFEDDHVTFGKKPFTNQISKDVLPSHTRVAATATTTTKTTKNNKLSLAGSKTIIKYSLLYQKNH